MIILHIPKFHKFEFRQPTDKTVSALIPTRLPKFVYTVQPLLRKSESSSLKYYYSGIATLVAY